MSLFKTFAVFFVLTAAAIVGLVYWHNTGSIGPLTEAPAAIADGGMLRAHNNPLASLPPLDSAAVLPTPKSAGIALSNDPRRAGPTVVYPAATQLDPDTAKRYAEAMDEIEVDACNRNGSFAIRLKGQRAPHILRAGQTVNLPNGMNINLRMTSYANCKLVVYDGTTAIGEVVGF